MTALVIHPEMERIGEESELARLLPPFLEPMFDERLLVATLQVSSEYLLNHQ